MTVSSIEHRGRILCVRDTSSRYPDTTDDIGMKQIGTQYDPSVDSGQASCIVNQSDKSYGKSEGTFLDLRYEFSL
ncbi:MAG: hypothetical protein WDA68_12175 [Phycisphaerae bacterium]